MIFLLINVAVFHIKLNYLNDHEIKIKIITIKCLGHAFPINGMQCSTSRHISYVTVSQIFGLAHFIEDFDLHKAVKSCRLNLDP
jgi:hypothetical protein